MLSVTINRLSECRLVRQNDVGQIKHCVSRDDGRTWQQEDAVHVVFSDDDDVHYCRMAGVV